MFGLQHRHGRQASHTGPTQQLQQDRFSLIILMMRGEQQRHVVGRAHIGECIVASESCRLLIALAEASPRDFEESAQLDGASRFAVFWDIVLPLTRPGLAATTLLTLILNWNEYLFAVFLATSKVQTMPIMVAAKNAGEKGVFWWEMCAIIVVMIIPVILMAILLQRFIAKGVLLGAVKG